MKRIIQAAALSLVMLSGSVCAVAQKRAVPGFFVLQEFATLKPYNQLSQDEKRDLLRTALFSKEMNARNEAIKRLEGNFSNEQVKQIRDFDGGGELIRATSLYNQNTMAMIGNIKNAKGENSEDLAVIAYYSGQPNTREEARNKLEQLSGTKIDWDAKVPENQNLIVNRYLNSVVRASKSPIAVSEELTVPAMIVKEIEEEQASSSTGKGEESFEQLSADARNRVNEDVKTRVVEIIKKGRGLSEEQVKSFNQRAANLRDSLTEILSEIAKESELNKQDAINTFFNDNFEPSLKALEGDITKAIAAAQEQKGQESEAGSSVSAQQTAAEQKAREEQERLAAEAAKQKAHAEMVAKLKARYKTEYDEDLWNRAIALINKPIFQENRVEFPKNARFC